jgi:VanZ family protein
LNLSPLANRVLAFGLTAMLAVVIIFLTLLKPASAPGPVGVDKVYHFITFAGLMLPVATLRPRALVWMIPAALLFGAGIEIIQPYVNRSRDLADFLADGVGVLAGSALGLAIFWFRASAKASGTRS